jgi:hypothetical protein
VADTFLRRYRIRLSLKAAKRRLNAHFRGNQSVTEGFLAMFAEAHGKQTDDLNLHELSHLQEIVNSPHFRQRFTTDSLPFSISFPRS